MALLDEGGAVRQGEALDIQAVELWLKTYLPNLDGTVEVTQFTGGVSNWTYRLKYDNYDLILRRPPEGTKAKSAHDMSREFNIQSRLKPHYPVVPEMIGLCTDNSVLGCDFYVMQRVAGIIPRANLPKDLHLDPHEVHQLCLNMLDQLIALHQVDWQHAGLADLGKGEGYCKRQVDGWSKRYEQAKTWNVPSFNTVKKWLKDNTPADVATCIIHNDWRFDNVVLDPTEPTKVIGILDWEMATLGDPLMDLGSMLAYWVQADDSFVLRATRRQPTHLSGMLTREEVVRYYMDKTGIKTQNWSFYEVFGLFRLAVIAQQVYYRYFHKQTRNPAYKNFWIFIHVLNHRCLSIINKKHARS